MVLREWNDLPPFMKHEEVRRYYDILCKKRLSLKIKKGFDVIMALILLIVLSPAFLLISILIVMDSPGGVFFRQTRVTAYGRKFRIHKFRTMNVATNSSQSFLTLKEDRRITKVGEVLRRYRLDELPQLIDVIEGNMTFVGTRPEVPRYVKQYTYEMRATLLLPAGITSRASIRYKEESNRMTSSDKAERIYVKRVLPAKMQYNLKSLEDFSVFRDIVTMLVTVLAVGR